LLKTVLFLANVTQKGKRKIAYIEKLMLKYNKNTELLIKQRLTDIQGLIL
jgi:hypothetical protein